MEPPALDTVYQAISALYDNPNNNDKEKASIWLGDVQKSIHSWKIADELLQQKINANSCYFAAQTLRSKVQHNLAELPSDALLSLRDTLVVHLKKTSPDTGSSPILTQLCLALADLALQLSSWQNCISDLIKTFSNSNDYALLEILTVLPQEIDSSNLKLGENRREDIKSELRCNADPVTSFLNESIKTSQSTHLSLKIVKCMTSWIHVKAINIQEVPQNSVIGYCLQVLRDHNSINILHDAASDCICGLLHCFEDNNNNDEVERALFYSVSELEESYHMAVAHEEEEKAANFARIFTELGETFLEKIILSALSGSTHFGIKSLELALVCVGHHDYEVAEITFTLWYRLSEEVYHRDYQPLNDIFKPHVERLIEALARHCQCEPDQSELPEEGDDFYEFRFKVMELIKDVVFIVGSSSVFRQMFSTLQADMSWEKTEAALFVMQSVAKNILPDEYEYVPKVVEAILSMPDGTHPAVRKTCILLLGELCEWIEKHPECLESCLRTLVKALDDSILAYAAAIALQHICKASRSQAAAHTAALLSAGRRAESLPQAASAALMRAIAAAIGRLPPGQLSEAMREAVGVQLCGIRALLTSGTGATGTGTARGGRTDPVSWLDRLAALFRDVEAPAPASALQHPCLPALADAWPVLQDVMNAYQGDGRVMERVCRTLRFALRCVGAGGAGLVVPLATQLAALYVAHAHSCLLYLASVLLDELARTPSCVPALTTLLRVLMPRAFTLLQRPGALKENPDTVDDLFRLCIRFLQRIPAEFLSSEAMTVVVQCATLACKLDHREANSSVMKFLYDLVKAANVNRSDNQQIKELAGEIVSRHGADITYALLEASVLDLHSYMLSEVAEVLVELVWWMRNAGEDWLQEALRRLPRDRAHATDAQCWQFHQYVMRTEKCKEMTRLLRDFARLYR